MSSVHIKVTLIEFIVFAILIYCFMHEDKFIWFEENIKRIVVGNYRRFKRIRKLKKYKGRFEMLNNQAEGKVELIKADCSKCITDCRCKDWFEHEMRVKEYGCSRFKSRSED